MLYIDPASNTQFQPIYWVDNVAQEIDLNHPSLEMSWEITIVNILSDREFIQAYVELLSNKNNSGKTIAS